MPGTGEDLIKRLAELADEHAQKVIDRTNKYPEFLRVAEGLQAGVIDFSQLPSDSEGAQSADEKLVEETKLIEANSISSRIQATRGAIEHTDGFDDRKIEIEEVAQHYVVLDIDHDGAMIPSTTPGHHHLIIRKQMSWEHYLKLMEVMAEVGLVQEGYLEAARRRKATWVRCPWEAKRPPESKAEPLVESPEEAPF